MVASKSPIIPSKFKWSLASPPQKIKINEENLLLQ